MWNQIGKRRKSIHFSWKISLFGAGIALRGRFFCAEPGIFSFAGSTSGAGGAEREKKARKKQEVLFCSHAVWCLRGGKREESRKKTGSSLLQPCRPVPAGRKGRGKQEKARKFSFAALPAAVSGEEREKKQEKERKFSFGITTVTAICRGPSCRPRSVQSRRKH